MSKGPVMVSAEETAKNKAFMEQMAASGTERYIRRHSKQARWTHGITIIACILLCISGLFVFVPALAAAVGADTVFAIRMSHRIIGVVFVAVPLISALLAVLSILTLAVFAVRACRAGRSSFYVIAACAATSMMVFQTCLNVFGSVDLLPLTGVTFPFVSNGGSAMMSAWGLLAYLKATDTRENASFAIARKHQRRLTQVARRRAEPIGDPFGTEKEERHEEN